MGWAMVHSRYVTHNISASFTIICSNLLQNNDFASDIQFILYMQRNQAVFYYKWGDDILFFDSFLYK